MAQPAQAPNQDPVSKLDELERSAEPADRTNPQADNSQGSPKPDTTAVVTQVTKQGSTPVNADQPANQDSNPNGGAATDPNAPAPTEASGTSDQPGESGSTDNPTDGEKQNGDGKEDEGTSANNGVPPPPMSDPHGLELSINEIPNFDQYVTKQELRNLIDKVIQNEEKNGHKNSRELLMLKRFMLLYFNTQSVSSICKFLRDLNLGIELPVTLKKITQGVRK